MAEVYATCGHKLSEEEWDTGPLWCRLGGEEEGGISWAVLCKECRPLYEVDEPDWFFEYEEAT